jgi:hypothetical protein
LMPMNPPLRRLVTGITGRIQATVSESGGPLQVTHACRKLTKQ